MTPSNRRKAKPFKIDPETVETVTGVIREYYEKPKEGRRRTQGLKLPVTPKTDLATAPIKLDNLKHKKRSHPEGDLQIQCLKWFNYQYRRFQENMVHTPNQLVRKGHNGHWLSRLGVKSGVPDLVLYLPRLHYHALFLELKAPKGTLSSNQKRMIEVFTNSGYLCKVIRSFNEFQIAINSYLK